LIPFKDGIPVLKPHVHDRLLIAMTTGCLDLLDAISDSQKPHGPRKELSLEVRSQTVANNGDPGIDRQVTKGVNVDRIQELSLINEDTV
jgi:hypothetical protein